MKRAIAGPTLRALVASALGRVFAQVGDDGAVADYRRSGTSCGSFNGVDLRTDNVLTIEPGSVRSRMVWEIANLDWTLHFTERRELDAEGHFVKSAPYQIALIGDLLEAARFLGIPRQMFLDSLRADGWSAFDVTIESLRWIDVPAGLEAPQLRLVLQG